MDDKEILDRAERDRKRREIEDLLIADAIEYPCFALARRCAVMAWAEAFDMAFCTLRDGAATSVGARSLLEGLHIYERHRGDDVEPNPRANYWFAGVNTKWIAVYERNRAK